MEWLSANKIPVGDISAAVFDWIQEIGENFFDAVADGGEATIDAFLWVLQTPPTLIVIAVFVGIAWALQRSWKIALFVALGFLFILNQGYWEETTESLTLVLCSCIVCMAIGVPIGIIAARRPRLYSVLRPILD
ncbi:MAG: choline ABC transporter permease subunit, partial [Mangrovicoccus sp.]